MGSSRNNANQVRIIGCVLCAVLCLFSVMGWASETVTIYTENTHPPQQAFILFYSAQCPHCQRFDPVLKAYAVRHHIPVLAYTLEGGSLPSFPNSVMPTPAELHRFFPNGHPVVPTLFLMVFAEQRILPVLQGEASSAQLAHRMQQLNNMQGNASDG